VILEDSPTDVELLHELRRAGFEPHWQQMATEPDCLAQLAPPPDIILADYTLPQFDALRALRCVQERAPNDCLLKERLGRLGEAVRHALAERDPRVQHRPHMADLTRWFQESHRAVAT
jgi:CheY-like chemotaxis protein